LPKKAQWVESGLDKHVAIPSAPRRLQDPLALFSSKAKTIPTFGPEVTAASAAEAMIDWSATARCRPREQSERGRCAVIATAFAMR
jgi:hypothetical protein